MKNHTLLIIALSLVIIMLLFHYLIKNQPTQEEVEQMTNFVHHSTKLLGKEPADFELDLINGTKLKLSDYLGKKIIIINFFAVWCQPCKMEIPELNRYFDKIKNKDCIIIGIDAGDKLEQVLSFVTENKVKFIVGMDNDGSIMKKYNVESYPTTIVIGLDKKIKMYEIGAISNADVTFDNLVKTQLNSIKK